MMNCKKCIFWTKTNTVTPEGNIRKGFPQVAVQDLTEDEREGKCGMRDGNITKGRDCCMSGIPKPPSANEPPVDIVKKRGKK